MLHAARLTLVPNFRAPLNPLPKSRKSLHWQRRLPKPGASGGGAEPGERRGSLTAPRLSISEHRQPQPGLIGEYERPGIGRIS